MGGMSSGTAGGRVRVPQTPGWAFRSPARTFDGVSGYYPVPMISLLRRLRPLTYFFALVQLALPGALGVAHAISAHDQHGSPAHIEENSGPRCVALHSDECAVCRHLSTGATKSELAATLLPEVADHATTSPVASVPSSHWPRGFNSRAPPAALS